MVIDIRYRDGWYFDWTPLKLYIFRGRIEECKT